MMKALKIMSVVLAIALTAGLTACTGVGESSSQSGTDAISSSVSGKNQSSAFAVKSSYSENRLIVAEVDATSPRFGADPTGKIDSTVSIQLAIDYCAYQLKGGTVYLPAGNYRVNGRIIVRTGITLAGEYADPDTVKGNDYGTMLYAYTENRFDDAISVIMLEDSSALDGITVFYPEQNADNPIPYYYTVDCKDSGSRTIKNLTLLNSYCGITNPLTVPFGLATFENIKGTVLKTGLFSYSEADICYYSDISFSPEYWSDMDASFAPPTAESIRSAMRKTESTGISLVDIDRSCFMNITLDGYKYGIYNGERNRAGWSGSWYNVRIIDAEYGIYALGISPAYGVNFSNSSITASSCAILNQTPSSGDGSQQFVNLYNSTVSGGTTGMVKKLTGTKMTPPQADTDITLPTSETLYNVLDYGADKSSVNDSTEAFQDALDAANEKGGGIVYVPAGKYTVSGTLTVYKGTLLLGSMYYSSQQTTYGSVLLAYSKEKDFITVSGAGAGVVGLYIAYPENGIYEDDYTSETKKYPFTVRCTAKDSYVRNLTLVGASQGVRFENADDFVLDRLFMTVWDCGVSVSNSNNGCIFGVHTNATYTGDLINNDARFSKWLNTNKTINGTDTAAVYVMIDSHIRNTLTLIKITGSSDIKLIDDFCYGARNFAEIDSSTVFFLNNEGSRLNSESGFLFRLTGSSLVSGMNIICYDNAENILFSVEEGSTLKAGNINRAHANNYYRKK